MAGLRALFLLCFNMLVPALLLRFLRLAVVLLTKRSLQVAGDVVVDLLGDLRKLLGLLPFLSPGSLAEERKKMTF